MLNAACADEMREVSVCHSGYFRAKCAWDELIVVAHARYGRMRINKCVSENFGYVGCSIDVIDVLDRYCSGRRTCHVRVLDETFTESTPCHEDLNLYLQVEYQCLRGRPSCYQSQSGALYGPATPAATAGADRDIAFTKGRIARYVNTALLWRFVSRLNS